MQKVSTMQPQTLKQEALESLQRLPDGADIDEIMYRFYVVSTVARALLERRNRFSMRSWRRELGKSGAGPCDFG